MKCEGDIVYNTLGDCPVCKMHLVSVYGKESKAGNHKREHAHEKEATRLHNHMHEAISHGTSKYYCPMHCEGD